MKTSDEYYIAFGNLNSQDIQVCVEISTILFGKYLGNSCFSSLFFLSTYF